MHPMSTPVAIILILAVIGAGTILNAVREFIADRVTLDTTPRRVPWLADSYWPRPRVSRRWNRPGAWVADAHGRRGRVLELADYGYGSIGTVAVVQFVDEHGWDMDPILAPVKHLYPCSVPVIEDEPARVAV